MAKKEEPALTKTLRVTNSKAFTLVEILIVVALIALVSAVAIPSMNFVMKTSPETFARQLTQLLKEARDRALLNSNIVRLRVDLDAQEYNLEEAPDSILIPSQAEQEKTLEEEKRNKDKGNEKDKQEKPSDGFRLLRELTKEKQNPPRGIKFVEILTPRSKKPVFEGVTFLYFFPRGGADNAIIHLQDEDGVKESIFVQPVTGISRFRSGFLNPEDIE